MASGTSFLFAVATFVILSSSALFLGANAQLSPNFYATSCPNLETIVRGAMEQAVHNNSRVSASLLRIHFHDCWVQGCDASILLEDTDTLRSELRAPGNANLRGRDVIQNIKSLVELSCNHTVSCADILQLATRDGVVLAGGPSWTVPLGRRDSLNASLEEAGNLPGPNAELASLITMFRNKGLDAIDLTALTGAHTVGFTSCGNARTHLYEDTNINSTFASMMQVDCPRTGGDSNQLTLDNRTVGGFDNNFFRNLIEQKAVLHSDQVLFNGGSQDALVTNYSTNQTHFFTDFANAMIKMGNLSPLTGMEGEIRASCRSVNP